MSLVIRHLREFILELKGHLIDLLLRSQNLIKFLLRTLHGSAEFVVSRRVLCFVTRLQPSPLDLVLDGLFNQTNTL